MILSQKSQSLYNVSLLPHQAEFVETILGPKSKKITFLSGNVGLGKSYALVAAAAKVIAEKPAARVLIIAPAALLAQFYDMLQAHGTSSQVADRYVYRKMLDATTGTAIWPGGVVTIVSIDVARQPDVSETLVSTKWDLVIADEIHIFRGLRAQLLEKLIQNTDRLAMAGTTNADLPKFLRSENTATVTWTREKLVDQGGTPLSATPNPLINDISYSLSRAELELLQSIRSLNLKATTEAWAEAVIRRSAQSSPQAVENILRRVRERFVAQAKNILDPHEQGVLPFPNGEAPRSAEDVVKSIDDVLEKLEAIDQDTKLNALLQLLRDLEKSPRHICVVTNYVSTFYYLTAALETNHILFDTLDHREALETNLLALDHYVVDGGILLVTGAAARGKSALAKVTDVVLYERPSREEFLKRTIDQFIGFSRREALKVHLLIPLEQN